MLGIALTLAVLLGLAGWGGVLAWQAAAGVDASDLLEAAPVRS